jgi:hypothetical protein
LDGHWEYDGAISMNRPNPRAVESKIARLNRELADIENYFYHINETTDRFLHASMLEHKRDDIVRSAVLQVHTSIEDLLMSHIASVVLGVKPEERSKGMRTTAGKALRKMLYGAGSIGFDMKLSFASALGILNSQTVKKLSELNTLRNKCSHNWLLKTPVRRGKRPKQKKSPLLLYRGRDLHKVDVLKDFAAEYGSIYTRLFLKYVD